MRSAIGCLVASVLALGFVGLGDAPAQARHNWVGCGSATWAPIYYSAKNVSCREAFKVMKAARPTTSPFYVRDWRCVVTSRSMTGIAAKCTRGNQQVKIGWAE